MDATFPDESLLCNRAKHTGSWQAEAHRAESHHVSDSAYESPPLSGSLWNIARRERRRREISADQHRAISYYLPTYVLWRGRTTSAGTERHGVKTTNTTIEICGESLSGYSVGRRLRVRLEPQNFAIALLTAVDKS